MNKEDVLAQTRALVADSLALPLEKVKPESRLINDLDADSLDFVDILFQIERKFGVKIKTSELNFLSGLDFSSPAVMQNGLLTPETVEKLKSWLPALAEVENPGKVTPAQLFALVSIGTLCTLIERKLAENPAAAGA